MTKSFRECSFWQFVASAECSFLQFVASSFLRPSQIDENTNWRSHVLEGCRLHARGAHKLVTGFVAKNKMSVRLQIPGLLFPQKVRLYASLQVQ